jgi:L-threonylcarbamoyladenylate synthase
VGRRAQAIELASAWTDEMRLLTDRMWPGPLTVIVPAAPGLTASPGGQDAVVHITMPASRALRALCRRSGPLTLVALPGAEGQPVVTPEEASVRCAGKNVALVIDGGTCRGPGPTVVDCTVSPPTVGHVGAFPENYVDAALMMSARRRKWFARRSGGRPGTTPAAR